MIFIYNSCVYLYEQLVSGYALDGHDEERVERQFSLVLSGSGLEEAGERRLGVAGVRDGRLGLLPVVDERRVALDHALA